MRTITINIGLETNDGSPNITPDQAIAALRARGGFPKGTRLAQSATEPTLVVELCHPLPSEALFALSVDLLQDCIAYHDGFDGTLHGPLADTWGPFTPAYFITHTGEAL